MHNLYIMWIYALRFVTLDVFSLLYSNLINAKLSLFVLGATFDELIGKLLAYVAVLFVTSVYRLLSLRD